MTSDIVNLRLMKSKHLIFVCLVTPHSYCNFREDSSDTDLDGDFSDLETSEGKYFFVLYLKTFK